MPPLLFIVFNRPELTEQSFQIIRRAKPEILYVAADAPRAGRAGEAERCEAARRVTDAIDWDCNVHRLYADTNLGCGRRISSAVTSVLRQHESLIVLEDDCLPDDSFFTYCVQLLHRFADDERIMAVSGDNYQLGVMRTNDSYYYSKYAHCWGWATWRRAWQHFDLSLAKWPAFVDCGGLDSWCLTVRELAYWKWIINEVREGSVDSWALPWGVCCWMQNGLTVLPARNLVSNVGFGADATHTAGDAPYANLPRFPMGELRHPECVVRNEVADQFTDELLYSGPWEKSQRRQRRRNRPWPLGRRKFWKAA